MQISKSEYKYVEDLVEIIIELKNGLQYVLIAEGNCGLYGVKMSIFYLYNENEKIGTEGLRTKCFSFAMPESDIEAEVNGGMLMFKKNNEIIFLERRDLISRIIVGTEDNWIDLCEEQRKLFERELEI